jgi:hypothetical protein
LRKSLREIFFFSFVSLISSFSFFQFIYEKTWIFLMVSNCLRPPFLVAAGGGTPRMGKDWKQALPEKICKQRPPKN